MIKWLRYVTPQDVFFGVIVGTFVMVVARFIWYAASCACR